MLVFVAPDTRMDMHLFCRLMETTVSSQIQRMSKIYMTLALRHLQDAGCDEETRS